MAKKWLTGEKTIGTRGTNKDWGWGEFYTFEFIVLPALKPIAMEKDEYLEIVRKLPRPTAEQTKRFLDEVSTQHSWYKKLGYPTGTAFLFFLDPNIEKTFVYKGTGDYYYEDRETYLKSNEYANYRNTEYLGYWSYHTNYRETIWEITAENGMIDEYRHLGYNILSPSNKVITMSDELKAIGTVKISKLFYEFNSSYVVDFNIEKSQEELKIERDELIKRIEQTMENFLDYVYG